MAGGGAHFLRPFRADAFEHEVPRVLPLRQDHPGYHLLSRCDKAGLQTPNENAITTEPANQRHLLREKRIVDKLVGDCGQGSVSGADQSGFRERKQLFFVVPESFLVFVRRASH